MVMTRLDKELDKLYDYLLESEIATLDEVSLVCSINGTNIDSLNSILYSRTGYRSLDRIKEMEEN